MTSERVQAFGGEHTRRKLDVVAKYLAAYVTVMKKQDFRLSYVDGFAGSGASTPKAESQKSDDPTLFPTADVMEGSPVRALGVEPPFDRYVFIEKREKNVRSLSGLSAQFPTRQIDVVHGDANERLREFCDGIAANRLDRAVILLDPFGLSVRWETIERIRARPVEGEFYPTSMVVECSKDMRTRYPVGTRFRIYAKETDREGNPPFLYTHFSWPYDVVE